MNILIVFLLSGGLKTLYDTEGKYDHVEVGAFVLDSNGVNSWVVSLPGSVQEGNHVLQSERPWLLEQGKQYAQQKGDAVLLYRPDIDGLVTVFDAERRYRDFKENVFVYGGYGLCFEYDCTADTIPDSMQASQLTPYDHELYMVQGRAYALGDAKTKRPQ